MRTLLFDSAFFATGQDLEWIIWLVVANIVLGLLTALLKGNFNFHHLSNYLISMVFPYVFLYGVFKDAVDAFQYGGLVITLTFVFIVLSLAAGIWEELGHFGLPAPKWLSRGER